jgi:hypothetical protein
MRNRPNIAALVREMQENGFDDRQAQRYDRAFHAAKVAAVTLMCARHGAHEEEMLEAVTISPRLAAEAQALVARIELSPTFVRHVHSGSRF